MFCSACIRLSERNLFSTNYIYKMFISNIVDIFFCVNLTGIYRTGCKLCIKPYCWTQMHFLIGGETVKCHKSKLITSLGLTNFMPMGNNILNILCDWVVHLATTDTLFTSFGQACNFLQFGLLCSWEVLVKLIKLLVQYDDWPKRSSESDSFHS